MLSFLESKQKRGKYSFPIQMVPMFLKAILKGGKPKDFKDANKQQEHGLCPSSTHAGWNKGMILNCYKEKEDKHLWRNIY